MCKGLQSMNIPSGKFPFVYNPNTYDLSECKYLLSRLGSYTGVCVTSMILSAIIEPWSVTTSLIFPLLTVMALIFLKI